MLLYIYIMNTFKVGAQSISNLINTHHFRIKLGVLIVGSNIHDNFVMLAYIV